MFHRILVPLDGSKRAESALPVAARIARSTGATLHLLRVVPPPTDASLDALQAALSPEDVLGADVQRACRYYLVHKRQAEELQGIPVELSLATGTVPQRILSCIETQSIDLVVICSRGETGLKRWTLGSVAQKLLRHSRAPVLVLHESTNILWNQRSDGCRPARVLVALDGSPLAETALEPSGTLAAALSAPARGAVHLLCVIPPSQPKPVAETTGGTPHLDLSEARMYLQMTAQAAREGLQGSKDLLVHTSVVEEREVAETIMRTAEKVGASDACDVIALASHGRSGLARWVMGSIAERLLDGTRLPLLVVPRPGL